MYPARRAGQRSAATDLRLRFAAATIFIAYDEVTPQAPGLADDRDRNSRDPLRFLFCEGTGLRRDEARRRWPDLRPQGYPTRS